jgi:hypothetical protein
LDIGSGFCDGILDPLGGHFIEACQQGLHKRGQIASKLHNLVTQDGNDEQHDQDKEQNAE